MLRSKIEWDLQGLMRNSKAFSYCYNVEFDLDTLAIP